MYVEKIPNRNSPPCALIRESFREDGKVHKRTLANISHLPDEIIEQIRKLLKGGSVIGNPEDDFKIIRSLPYANVKAVLATLRRIGLDKIISSSPQSKNHKLVTAMIIARIINPCSKLATVRSLNQETCCSVLSDLLNIPEINENDLYHAMDWLLARQDKIELSLAGKHLENGSLVLYDVSSSYFEGSCCPLAMRGHDKDHKKSKLIIVYGLLCNKEGCPVAIEVFEGNTGDPTTVKAQIEKLINRFGLERIIIVGDRGMLTSARIKEDLKPVDGIDWISALKAPQIRKIMRDNEIEKSLFDKRDIAEITHPDFPGERLMVCYNPLLETKRQKTRQSLLAATEKELQKIVKATSRKRKPPRTVKEIAMAVGKVINKYKVGKHFEIDIKEGFLAFQTPASKVCSGGFAELWNIV